MVTADRDPALRLVESRRAPTQGVELYIGHSATASTYRVGVSQLIESDDMPYFNGVSLNDISEAVLAAGLNRVPRNELVFYYPKTEGERPDKIGLVDNAVLLDLVLRELSVDDKIVETRPKEFDLLSYFFQHQRALLSREQLLAGVWKDNSYRGRSTVTEHVRWVRNKLGGPDGYGGIIQTIHGKGYRCIDPTKSVPEF